MAAKLLSPDSWPADNGDELARQDVPRGSRLQVLDHFPAGGRTVLAGFGTIGHVLILGEFLSRGSALIARLGTGFAINTGKRTVARLDLACLIANLTSVGYTNH